MYIFTPQFLRGVTEKHLQPGLRTAGIACGAYAERAARLLRTDYLHQLGV